MKNILSKYGVVIISCIVVLIVGLLVMFFVFRSSDVEIREFDNKQFSLKYDTTWNIKENKDNKVKLVHNHGGIINIEVILLEEEYKFLSIDDLLEELIYNLEKQNSSYKLLSKKKDLITKYRYEGYKLLYENGNNQVLIYVAKNSDKLMFFIYEACNDDFDIMLDSVQNMIYDFKILSDAFNLTYQIELDSKNIDWNKNDEIKNVSNVSYEIANKNYYVNYSIPESFELNSFNSTYSFFNYKGLTKGSIGMTVNVYNQNIYRYVNKDEGYSSLYSYYNIYRNPKDNDTNEEDLFKSTYYDFKESLQKLDNSDILGYIYKNSYKSKGYFGESICENVVLVYELDNSHIISFKISGDNSYISKELVDNIKLNSFKNYASYISIDVVDGNLIGELKEYTDYKRQKIKTVTLRVPKKYQEIDNENNIYEKRYYALNYDDEREIFEYNVNYGLYFSSSLEKVDSLNSNYESLKRYGKYSKIKYKNDITLNGKKFKVYEGGFTNITPNYETKYFMNVVILGYEFEDGKSMYIEINGNDVKISNEILNELTNFDINYIELKEGE